MSRVHIRQAKHAPYYVLFPAFIEWLNLHVFTKSEQIIMLKLAPFRSKAAGLMDLLNYARVGFR